LKILLTVHQFFPEYFSGTEVLTFSVAKELKKRGHDVYVFTGFPARTHMPEDERFDEYDIEGIHVYRFHHAYVPMGGQAAVTEVEYDNHLTARYFTRLLRDLKPDIVHFFHLSRLGVGLIDAAVGAKIPAYYTPTDFWSVCPTSQLLLRDGSVCPGPSQFGGNCVKHVAELTRGPAVRRVSELTPRFLVDAVAGATAKGLLPRYPLSGEIGAMARRRPFNISRLNWLDAVISPTKLMTGVLKHNGIDPDLIVESAYGIDITATDVTPASREAGRPLTVGFIGTLAQHKGPHVLIEAFRKLDPATARLKIYGNPSDFPDYFARLKELAAGASNIEFCGTFPNAQVATVLAGVDVLVVPSLWYENTPLVVYSALAAKRPVVVSDFAGLVETIKHDWNGLVFAPGNVTALAQQLRRLVDDMPLLASLSANCKRPKSSVEYVDELLGLYARPRQGKSAAPRRFEPLEDTRGLGFITGWAVINKAAPQSVQVLDGDTVRGETTQLLPRPDVRDGLSRGGANIGSALLGFAVRLRQPFDRKRLVLRVRAQSGETQDIPLTHVNVGTSVAAGSGCFVGIDSERQPTAL
jgi:glycosyltransferase involved in cell wall biosynthesis